LGPYVVIAGLGEGGMGEVYHAHDERLGRDVAIKVLPAAFASDPDRLRRIEREARAVGQLNHPNVLAIYDIGTHQGSPFLVTELLKGETLRTHLQNGPLGPRKAVDWAIQIAQGLAAAHQRGIVHRDLKPGNLFVTRDHLVKILDFGLAKVLEPESSQSDDKTLSTLTESGAVLGTTAYMSPEQARGDRADQRSDLFAFGAVLYEMLSGQRPFQGTSPVETLHAVLTLEPTPLAALKKDIAPALDEIVRHCLEKAPEERFQSARDLVFDLKRVSGTAIPTPIVGGRWSARRKRLMILMPLLAVFASGPICYVSGRQAGRLPPPDFHRLTYRRGYLSAARFAPEGHSLVYGACWDGGPLRLYSMRPESPESTPLSLPDAQLLSISSNGEMAILLRAVNDPGGFWRGTLARVALAGGAPREILDDVAFADWSPRGGDLALVYLVGGKYRLEYPVGNVLYETAGLIREVRFSPKGNLLAFFDAPTVSDRRASVAVVDLSGKKQDLTGSWPDVAGLAWSPDGREIWFGATESGMGHDLHAVSMAHKHRLVMRMAGGMTLHDVSRSGRVLVTRENYREVIAGLGPGQTQEHDLSWLDWSGAADLSPDGRTLLFSESGEGAGPNYAVCLRGTDGSSVVRLGDGLATSLSPDGKWALSVVAQPRPGIVLLPTGAGAPRRLEAEPVREFVWATWLPDGQKILFGGSEPGHAMRCYIQDLSGGKPSPIGPEGASLYTPCSPLSPDGRWLVLRGPDQKPALTMLQGGEELRPIPGLGVHDWPTRWADNHTLFVQHGGGVPLKVGRVDVASGSEELFREFAPGDLAGVTDIGNVVLSRNLSAYVYGYLRLLHDLYVVDGLR
jgi:serine/threonine protein kinase/Tol biopolymer transport system component